MFLRQHLGHRPSPTLGDCRQGFAECLQAHTDTAVVAAGAPRTERSFLLKKPEDALLLWF